MTYIKKFRLKDRELEHKLNEISDGDSICQNIFPGLINTYGEINGVSSRPT